LSELFEEAALALADLAWDRPSDRSGGLALESDIALAASDRDALLVAWLNELVGLGEIHRAPIVETHVRELEPGPPARLRATVKFGRVGGTARPRLAVKGATYHGLIMGQLGRAWRLNAYLDV
jgi:SHS2 domain-containing protein